MNIAVVGYLEPDGPGRMMQLMAEREGEGTPLRRAALWCNAIQRVSLNPLWFRFYGVDTDDDRRASAMVRAMGGRPPI